MSKPKLSDSILLMPSTKSTKKPSSQASKKAVSQKTSRPAKKQAIESQGSQDLSISSIPFSKSQIIDTVRNNRKYLLILLLLVLAVLVYLNRSMFVAATVNGQPVFTSQLSQRMASLYKEKTLQQMVDETIIEQEAVKKGVRVTDQQIKDKMVEVEKSYGGAEIFDSLLAQQGLTRDEFARQTKLNLIVEALYKNEASASADEIEKFMEGNSNIPEATDPAKFRALAEEQVKQQNLYKIIGQKFQELKQQAKVTIF